VTTTSPTGSSATKVPDAADPRAAERTERFRQRVAGVCLVLAPLAFAAAELLAPEVTGSSASATYDAFAADRTGSVWATMFGLLSTILFLPALFGLLTPVVRRGSRWGHAALAATIYGLVMAHAALGGVNLAFWAMSDPSLDRSAMLALLRVIMGSPAVGAPLLIGHYIFGLGIVALGVAVIRSRLFPRWTGYAVIASLLVDMVLGTLPVPGEIADVLSDGLLIAGMGAIGLRMLGRRTSV
jgi:hypothetical protein